MKTKAYLLTLLAIGSIFTSSAQIIQDFNQSVNQIGNCWQKHNMEITTKKTINSANQKKALVGKTPDGYPAYYFMSPMIRFNGTGMVEFRHKLTDNDGIDRSVTLWLYDQAERPVQAIYTHIYRQGNTAPNGNPTNVMNVSFPITWTGNYFVRWEFSGRGGKSLAMVDDISIDGVDVSDGSNDNGYGYCRPDDEVWDTVCAGELALHKVPYVIPGSDWEWDFMPGFGVGLLDSTLVKGPKDSMVNIRWSYTAAGDYSMEATEIRPPYNTRTYSVWFYIHVLPAPTVELSVDSVCPGNQNNAVFTFTGNGPWTVTYQVSGSIYTELVTTNRLRVSLPEATSSRDVTVMDVTNANGCSSDPLANPQERAVVFPHAIAGPIYRF